MPEATDELRAVLEQMPESVAVYDLDAKVIYLNPATERVFGRTLAELKDRVLWEVFPDAVGNPFHQAFRRVAAGGPVEVFDHFYPPFERWFANRVERVDTQVHVVARDVTDDVRRRRRLEALARISSVLTNDDLGLEAALQAVALVLRDMLDADASLALLSADGAWLDLAATAPCDPAVAPVVNGVRRWRADAGHPGEALRTRQAILADASSVEAEARRVEDPAMREVVQRYGPVSVLAAPLLAGDEAIGVLLATRRQGGRPLTSDDRLLVTAIAPSVGLYVAHARRRAEAGSLRHRLSTVADSNPALVSLIGRDLRYQYVNASYERWFGRPRSAFLGQRLDELLGEGYEAIAPHVREALEGRAVRFRATVAYPSGERHVDAHYEPIRAANGAVEGFAATVLDITAEARLAEQERARLEGERQATRRLESLLALTGKLAAADTPDEIARVVVDEGIAALDANLAGLWLLSTDGRTLVLQRERGFRPEHGAAFARLPADGPGPVGDCLGSGRPVWVESRADYAARYPAFEPVHRPAPAPPLAFAILPLLVEGQRVGCMNFTFHDERRLTPDERTYLEVLASHAAEALRRARLYAELRDVSQTRQAMIQASPAAIMLLDADGVVHAWNSAAERIFGWSAAETVGRVLPAVGEERRAEFLANLAHVLAGNVIDGRVTKRLRKNGEWFDVALYAAPVQLSEGRVRCLSMVFDVSERVRTERGRRLVAEATAILTRSFNCEVTLAEMLVLVTGAIADGCAIELGEESAAPQRITAGVDPASPAVRSTLSVPLAVGGRPLGTLTIASQSRALDDLDRTIVAELASHAATAIDNARLFREARSARRDAEAASGAKDQFLAMLGHELRNPLAPITTALHLMRLRAPHELERERAVIERQVTHLSRLVDDLLDVSRITRGKIELRRERTSIAGVVARAIEIASPLLEQRRHHLVMEVPPDLAVNGDPIRLGQVVANLLSNSAKYTEVGGRVELRVERRNDEAVIVVRDNGMGIPAEMLPTIFDMFVQASQPSARTAGGLGLGLAIVRSLVELHGGRVTAHSDGLGTGSTFVVVLPAAPALATEEPAAAPAVLPRSGTSRRVLIVDDNEDAAVLIGESLDARGHQIRTAFDGPSALRIAEEFRPEIAVVDIGLPVMDGYELAQRLRTNASALRLIAVTGYGQDSDRARSHTQGFQAHLAKPVSMETLVRLIEDPS